MSGRRFVGLMSGSSADAVDAVVLALRGPELSILATYAEPIDEALREAIVNLTRPSSDELTSHCQLDVRLGHLFANAALAVIDAAALTPNDIIAIGSHGQTARHDPRGPLSYTLQIGDPNVIAERTGITTVADFRRRDIAAGGEGAPLVPAFHAAFFHSPGERTAILNIGGIANVTCIDHRGEVQGFDTGPGNCLMDYWIRRCKSQRYDSRGSWAATGSVDEQLLNRMLADPFLNAMPPKSTGIDYFHGDWLAAHLSSSDVAHETVQRTLLELTAVSVAKALQHFEPTKLAVCGGGAHNDLLIDRLAALLAPVAISNTNVWGIDPDWVEAAAFAWLASRRLDGLSGNEPNVTGAQGYRVLGSVYPGR